METTYPLLDHAVHTAAEMLAGRRLDHDTEVVAAALLSLYELAVEEGLLPNKAEKAMARAAKANGGFLP